eukprot:10972920-Prorocentrum_lima.AAC.1
MNLLFGRLPARAVARSEHAAADLAQGRAGQGRVLRRALPRSHMQASGGVAAWRVGARRSELGYAA